jgi:Lysozyme like domain
MPTYHGPKAAALSGSDCANLAMKAGCPNAQSVVAGQIALAESGGVPNVESDPNTDGSHDLGLWQINDKAHADILAGKDWWVPSVNAQLMMDVSANGTKWTPWTTYNSGAYLKTGFSLSNWNYAAGSVNSSGVPTTLPPVAAVTSAVSGIPNAINGAVNAVTSQITKLAGNVAITLFVLVLFVVGFLLVTKKPVLGTIKKLPKVIPV